MRQYMMAVTAVAVTATLATADGETVVVPGSDVRYPVRTEVICFWRPEPVVKKGASN